MSIWRKDSFLFYDVYMKKVDNQKAVIIYGPPGSGKGTQAELLERNFDFIHFDSGRYIERLVHSKLADSDAVLKRERKNFDNGMLCDPAWTLKISSSVTKKVAKSGYNIVYSGSPRTVYEAFGEKKIKGLVETLEKEFGKKNVFVMLLKIKKGTSANRNSRRLICSVCGLQIMATHHGIKTCAFCGGNLRTRILDNPEVIKVRLVEYKNRTYPIVSRMKRAGFKVVEIDGEKAPYKVSEKIVKKLKLS